VSQCHEQARTKASPSTNCVLVAVAPTAHHDLVLSLDPYLFAARAYHHFKASPNGRAHLTSLLEGEAAFIAPPRM
jgi:hypothetical protein